MSKVIRILSLIVLLLVWIGDRVLLLVPKKQPVIQPKKRKVSRFRIIYPLPLSFKLKYFLIGMLFSIIFFFTPLIVLVFLQDLPNPRDLKQRPIPQTTKIYDRNGVLLFEIYTEQNRTFTELSQIPRNLINATIAIEDKDFWKHQGFDLLAITRALKKTFIDREPQGGSTITQQLIKATFLTPKPTLERKLKELVLAFWTERIYSKNEIIEMYLNTVPYGGTAWGVEAASKRYFDKSVRDLTLSEASLLAGLPAAPSTYSPLGSRPELARARQIEVLNRMLALGLLDETDVKNALDEELVFRPSKSFIRAPHFVLYVKDFLAQKYGLALIEQGGLAVKTSLDSTKQEAIEEIVDSEVDKLATLNVTNGASVVLDPKNGDILAMVGSRDYFGKNGNFNVALARRQPGSAIKAVTYASAFEHGYTAATILDDTPVSFPTLSGAYRPVNYDGQFHGRVSLRQAFANSYNVPAVKTLNSIGVDSMLEMGKRLGVKSWNGRNNFGLSLTLGGGEVTMMDLASVYATLANNGRRVDPNPILKVTNYKGEILEEKNPTPKNVLDGGIAFILSDILADNRARASAFGTNSPLAINTHRVSVKTGTSDNKRDNWTVGYTRDFVTAVWVGNNDNSPMHPSLTSGITGAAPIWNKIMSNLLENGENEQIVPPPDVIAIPCLGRTEYFIKGTEKGVNCKFLPTPIPTPEPSP